MQPEQASRTAEFMALFRALESARLPEQRLFNDPLAWGFLPRSLRIVVQLARLPIVGAALPWFIDRRWPGARSSAVARTRLIDDALANALRDGARQVVLLGAGFDSRAYRMPGIERARVFEVDHPATLAAKRERLTRMLGALPEHIVFVDIDFNQQALGQRLTASGFDQTVHSFFIWEGVTNYLTAEAVDSTLRCISTTAAPGSRIIFTYVHRGVLDGSVSFPGTQNVATTLASAGEPWTFGILPADLPAYLAARGFTLLDDIGASAYRTRYLGHDTKGYEFYRAALAEVRGSGRAAAHM